MLLPKAAVPSTSRVVVPMPTKSLQLLPFVKVALHSTATAVSVKFSFVGLSVFMHACLSLEGHVTCASCCRGSHSQKKMSPWEPVEQKTITCMSCNCWQNPADNKTAQVCLCRGLHLLLNAQNLAAGHTFFCLSVCLSANLSVCVNVCQ